MGDIIGQLSFGYSLNLQSKQDNRWLLPGLNLVSWRINAYMQLAILKKLDPVFRLLFRKVRMKYLQIVTSMINNRLSLEKNSKHDLYSFAIDHMGGGRGLGDSELWAEAFFFIIAGGTTPATAISAMFWYISRHPESYRKLSAEIRSVFETSDEIRAGDKLRRCEYLQACIHETLRIATPNTGILWREQRHTDENGKSFDGPLLIDGHVIPNGTLIGVNLYALHHNEKYFSDPFKFMPERWLDSNTEEIAMMKTAFAPFALGSRACSGKAVAYLEIGVTMAKTFWHFDFVTAPGLLGKVGGGEEGRVDGRGRPGEYQQYDTFSSVHDGPYLVFIDRHAANG
jgi:cytochrome P450